MLSLPEAQGARRAGGQRGGEGGGAVTVGAATCLLSSGRGSDHILLHGLYRFAHLGNIIACDKRERFVTRAIDILCDAVKRGPGLFQQDAKLQERHVGHQAV